MKHTLSLILALLMAVAVFAGCSSTDKADKAPEQEIPVPEFPEGPERSDEADEPLTLADWEGTGNSFSTYFEDEELEACEIVAEREELMMDEVPAQDGRYQT